MIECTDNAIVEILIQKQANELVEKFMPLAHVKIKCTVEAENKFRKSIAIKCAIQAVEFALESLEPGLIRAIKHEDLKNALEQMLIQSYK